jgi:hypothetical protein
MTAKHYRQGDILFTRIEELPEGLTERKSRVIAEGEATGHHHRLLDGRLLEGTQGLFLAIVVATQVVHQEHGPILLEPGYYRVTRQREYTPEAIRTVMD